MAKLLPLLAAFLFPTICQHSRDHFHKVLPAAEEGLVVDVCVLLFGRVSLRSAV